MMFRDARAIAGPRRNPGNFHTAGDIRSVPTSCATVGGPALASNCSHPSGTIR